MNTRLISPGDKQDLSKRLHTHVDRLAGLIGPRHVGYPALMVTDTSFLRNPHYHADTDTPGTLDYARMARATMGVAGAVSRLAKAQGRPGV